MADLFGLTIPQIYIAVGLIALALEILLLELSTIFLLFFGLASFVTGLLGQGGIIELGKWYEVLVPVLILSIFLSAIMWKPLKKYQNAEPQKDTSSDIIGHTFIVDKDLKKHTSIIHRFSGVDWTVKLDINSKNIDKNNEVVVSKIKPGVMWVKNI